MVVPERERDVIRSSEIGEKREIGCGCVIPKKKKARSPLPICSPALLKAASLEQKVTEHLPFILEAARRRKVVSPQSLRMLTTVGLNGAKSCLLGI